MLGILNESNWLIYFFKSIYTNLNDSRPSTSTCPIA